MSEITDRAKAVMQSLSQKTLSGAQMLSIATRYAERNGFSNPWDAEVNPTEHAAWPTPDELALYFLQRVRNQIRADLGGHAGREFDESQAANREAAMVAAQEEL